MIDSGLVGRKVFFRPLVRSHEERRWLFEEPTQSRISQSMLQYTKTNTSPPRNHCTPATLKPVDSPLITHSDGLGFAGRDSSFVDRTVEAWNAQVQGMERWGVGHPRIG